MLRVLSLGLSLPQSTFNASRPLRIILTRWGLVIHAPKILQARLVSDFATRWPEPPKAEDDIEGKMEPEPSERVIIRKDAWKGRFLREEILRRPIRPLRPPRPPPKHARPPEYPRGSPGGTGGTKKHGPRVAIHPLHRATIEETRGSGWNSTLEELLPSAQSSPASPHEASHAKLSEARDRDALLRILSETCSISEAWEAYNALLVAPKPHRLVTSSNPDAPCSASQSNSSIIPYAHLHRLARLLSTSRPRTRDLFLRLLSVLTTLRTTGGTIFVWEWNALIDCAGKGWRKTDIEDYRTAVDVFKDMVTSASSSTSSSEHKSFEGAHRPSSGRHTVAQPDIVTFTTLLDIASRTLSESALVHATSLLDASELPWNQITHMARLPYLIRTNQFEAVRDILRNAVQQGLDLYTLNGCLWAFARNGRLRVALQVYERLRRNIPAEERSDLSDTDLLPANSSSSGAEGFVENDRQLDNPILNIPGFVVPASMQPDTVTYTMLIQALCYHGDLIGALTIFRDMLSTIHPASRPPVVHRDSKARYYKPTLIIYRAIFLGFARHAHKRPSLASSLISRRQSIDVLPLPEFAARLTPSDSSAAARSLSPERMHHVEMPWTLENLEKLFESFLEMDWDGDGVYGDNIMAPTSRPNDRMIYWIMVAYAKTTKRDVGKMYKVWQQLDTRFGYGEGSVSLWSGRLARMSEALERGQRQSSIQQDGNGPTDSNG